MFHGFDEYEKLKVIRPIWDTHLCDKMGMPIVKAISENQFNFDNLKILNIQNISKNKPLSDCILLGYNYDSRLEKFWSDPLKYIPILQRATICSTPDYSIYQSMNYWQIAHNIFKNRWLGCFWQDYGIPVICSISWATPNTFDICFSGIEKGSIVTISTLGCTGKNSDVFLTGYKEMMKRIKPSLVIVFGNFIEGIYGRIIHVNYEDSFSCNKNNRIVQPTLFELPRIIEIKEVS